MKKRFSIIAFLFVIFIAFSLSATEEGGLPGGFLRIPVGSRPAGLGYTFTGVSEGVNTLYYNPGGLYQTENPIFAASFIKYSLDRTLNQLGLIYPLENVGNFGLQIKQFGIGDVDGRDPQGNPLDDFDDSRLCVDFGYGTKITENFGIGANFKYISHSLADYSARGIGFDTGLHFRKMFSKKVGARLGLSFNNMATSLKWDTKSSLNEKIPSTIRIGTAFDLNLSKNCKFLICADGVKTKDMDFEDHFGIESNFKFGNTLLELRIGMNELMFNSGFSIHLNKFSIDYAYGSDPLEENPIHSMGISYNFSTQKDRDSEKKYDEITDKDAEGRELKPVSPDLSTQNQEKKQVMIFDLNHTHPVANKKKDYQFIKFLNNILKESQNSEIQVYKFLTIAPYDKNIYDSYNIEKIRIRNEADYRIRNYSDKVISKNQFDKFKDWVKNRNLKLVQNESFQNFYVLENLHQNEIGNVKVTDKKEDINDSYYRENVSKICKEYFENKGVELSQIIYVTYYPLVYESGDFKINFYSYKKDKNVIIEKVKNK